MGLVKHFGRGHRVVARARPGRTWATALGGGASPLWRVELVMPHPIPGVAGAPPPPPIVRQAAHSVAVKRTPVGPFQSRGPGELRTPTKKNRPAAGDIGAGRSIP